MRGGKIKQTQCKVTGDVAGFNEELVVHTDGSNGRVTRPLCQGGSPFLGNNRQGIDHDDVRIRRYAVLERHIDAGGFAALRRMNSERFAVSLTVDQ